MELESWLEPILEALPRKLDELVDQSALKFSEDMEIDILDLFRAPKVPQISLSDYLVRFHEFSDSSTACYLLALVYIERLLEKQQVYITKRHIHRLILTSWVVASKFCEDGRYTNDVYSRIGGLKTDGSLNKLEVDFLCMIGFDLYVSQAECMRYFKKLTGEDWPVQQELKEAASSCSEFSCESSIVRQKQHTSFIPDHATSSRSIPIPMPVTSKCRESYGMGFTMSRASPNRCDNGSLVISGSLEQPYCVGTPDYY